MLMPVVPIGSPSLLSLVSAIVPPVSTFPFVPTVMRNCPALSNPRNSASSSRRSVLIGSHRALSLLYRRICTSEGYWESFAGKYPHEAYGTLTIMSPPANVTG